MRSRIQKAKICLGHAFKNTDINGSLGETQMKVRKMVEKTKYHHEQTVNKQVNLTCAAAEDLDEKEELIIRN